MNRITILLIAFVCFILIVFVAFAFCKTYAYCISKHTRAWKTIYRRDYQRIHDENAIRSGGSGPMGRRPSQFIDVQSSEYDDECRSPSPTSALPLTALDEINARVEQLMVGQSAISGPLNSAAASITTDLNEVCIDTGDVAVIGGSGQCGDSVAHRGNSKGGKNSSNSSIQSAYQNCDENFEDDFNYFGPAREAANKSLLKRLMGM